MHKEKTRQKRWAALAAAASLLAVCIVLLAGQVVASDQGSTEGGSPLHWTGIAPLDTEGFRGPSSPAAEGDWDGCQVHWPAVISDTDVYRMWYGGRALGNPGWGWGIGMAESEDGMSWVKAAGNPVLELGDPGEWDDQFRGLMAVLKDGGTYKMWYTGSSDDNPFQIGYATSADGSDWDLYASNPVLPGGGSGSWDEGYAANPTVLKDSGTFKMWYRGCNPDYSVCSIGYATSTDGLAWTKHAGNPVLTGTASEWDEGSVNSPTVVKNGGTYEMWYTGCNSDYSQCSVGRATSPDGMAWTKDTSNPVVNDGWDGTPIDSATVLLESGFYKMWLVSGEGKDQGIGLADSADGVDWNDYEHNPVLAPGAASLWINVNYPHDWVQGRTCGGAEVAVTVAGDEGVKAMAMGQASSSGRFSTTDWDWDPERPDIAPGDAVTATYGTVTTTVNPVGRVDGTLDYDADTAAGTVHAPWFSPQTLEVRCGVWENGAPEIEVVGIAADGGAFTCDFGAAGWNLAPGPDVWAAYVEPDGDFVMSVLHSLIPFLTVDYGHNWVQGEYEAGHTVWITVTESDGTTVKAVAEVTSYVHEDWGGWTGFDAHRDEAWTPERPDIEPGDWAYAMVDNGYDNAVQVGTIEGEANRETDIVSGTIGAPWLSPDLVTVRCNIQEDDGTGMQIEDVDPDGGAFFFDFSGEYDIQPNTDVAVYYREPDSDRVQYRFDEPVPDARVEKWPEGNDQAAAGGPVVFGLRYRNDGDGAANTITLTDTLPADTVYDSDTSGVTPTIDGDQVIWTLGPLPAHQERRFLLVLTNDADPGDTLTNQADIYTLYDGGDWNNHAEAEVDVIDEAPDLFVYKHLGGSEPTPGQTFLYEIKYGNDGPVPSGEVALTDTLPEGTSIVSWSSRDGHDLLWTEESNGDELVLSAPAIPGYWDDTLLLRLLLDSGVEPGTELTNTVEIETAGDTDLDNNQDERHDWVGDPRWDAGVYKQYGWGSLAPGREVGYNLHVRNHGNMAAGVLLTDTLPAAATFVEAWRWTGSTDEPFPPDYVDGEAVVWDLGTMEPGEWYDLNILLKIKPGTTPGTVLRNCATIAIDGQDTWPFNDQSCTEDRVSAAGPNLRVRKEYEWDGEDQLKYDVLVENVGTTRLENVWITHTYPESTTFEGDWWMGHGPWVTMTHGAGEITFWAEEFDPGNSARISFKVDLDDGIVNDQGLAFTNTVEAPLSGDVYPSDNQFEITAYTGPDLYARKRVLKGELGAGERITFLMEYGNRNLWPWEMSDETEVELTDYLPAGMTYVAAYWPDGNPNEPEYGGPGLSQIVWKDGRLGGEDTRWFTMVVDLDDDLAPGQVLLNEIEIGQDPEVDIDPIPGNNRFVYPVRLEGSKIYLPLVVRAY